MKKILLVALLLLLATPLFAQTSHKFGALDTDNHWTGKNIFDNIAAPDGSSLFDVSAMKLYPSFVDWAHPGSIGITTPNAGNFTALTAQSLATLPTWGETTVYAHGDAQGYATDGTVHYTFGTQRIQRKNYTTWAVLSENTTPFSGLTGYNHVGDGDYYNGKLYVPIEYSESGTSGGDHQSTIAIYDASTLARDSIHLVPDVPDISGLAVAPDQGANGLIYVVPFYEFTHIYVYDLSTFALVQTITLSTPIQYMQGIAYRDGMLYISSNGDGGYAGHAKLIIQVALNGSVQGTIYSTTASDEAEGIDYSQTEIRWAETTSGVWNVHYISPTAGNAKFQVATSGRVSATEAVSVANADSGGAFIGYLYNTAPNAVSFIGFKARGTQLSPTAIQNGDAIVGMYGKGWTGSAWSMYGAGAIRILAAETFDATHGGTLIDFATAPLASTTRQIRWQIDPDGTLINPGTSAINTKIKIKGYLQSHYLRVNQDTSGAVTENAGYTTEWNRDDVTKPAFAFLEHTQNARYEFRIASAAANPITWANALLLDASNATFTGKVTGSGGLDAGSSGIGNAGAVSGITSVAMTGMPTGCVQYPCQVAAVKLVDQTANITTTTAYDTTNDGANSVYLVSVGCKITTAGSAGTRTAAYTAAGGLATGTCDLTSLGNMKTSVVNYIASAGSLIQYSTTVTSNDTGKYTLTLTVLKLQ